MEGLSRSLPLFVGFLICAVSILCVAGHQARDYIYNQGASPLPDTEEGKALLCIVYCGVGGRNVVAFVVSFLVVVSLFCFFLVVTFFVYVVCFL